MCEVCWYSGARRFLLLLLHVLAVLLPERGVKEQRRYDDGRKDCTELFSFDSVDDGLSEKQVG